MSDPTDRPDKDPDERDEELPSPDVDVPEADALEQSRPWGGGGSEPPPRIPIDVPEADALEQAQDPGDDDEDDYRR